MKKITLQILLYLLLGVNVFASPPSRTQTYTPGEVISSSEVTENEDNIYNYLQAGVDTFADLTISNSDISSSANIQSDKLNLTSIAQAMLINSSGSLEVDGAANFDGAVDFDGSVTFAGTTIADLGTVTTGIVSGVSILSGSLNGAIGDVTRNSGKFTTLSATGETNLSGTLKLGTTNQGDVLYDNGTSIVRLTPGTNGQFLKTQGSSANPIWANAVSSDLYTSSGTWVAPTGVTKVLITVIGGGGGGGGGKTSGDGGGGGGGGASIIDHYMQVTSGNSYTITVGAGGAGGAGGGSPTSGVDGGSSSFVGDTPPFNYTVTALGGGKGIGADSGGTGGAGGAGQSETLNASGITGGHESTGYLKTAGGTGDNGFGSRDGGGGGGSKLGWGGLAVTDGLGDGGPGYAGGGGAGGAGSTGPAGGAGGSGGGGLVIIKYSKEN
jgi:hypothetical protein